LGCREAPSPRWRGRDAYQPIASPAQNVRLGVFLFRKSLHSWRRGYSNDPWPYSHGILQFSVRPGCPAESELRQMQQRRKRFQTGCVFLDAKTKTWFFRYYVDGKRKAERIQAKQAAEALRAKIIAAPAQASPSFAASGRATAKRRCLHEHQLSGICRLGRELHSA
jgi:hypothetical protein